MAILNNSNAISSGGYDINNSLRFRASASAYLNRTPASSGSTTLGTFSNWLKLGAISIDRMMYHVAGTSGNNNRFYISFNADDTVDVVGYNSSGSVVLNLKTTQVFRDPSAWYHVVVAIDTTQATAANRIKLYINGSQVTAFSTATYPAQNQALGFTNNTSTLIGSNQGVGNLFDGYMAETYFIDGQALTPSSFGETDTTTGSWKPKAYGGTYGTNGFYLKFSDIATTSGSNAGLGKDFSGNANYWTTNNISVTSGTTYDAMTDSPTLTNATVGNYCVLNAASIGADATLSNANLTIAYGSAATRNATMGTLGLSSGKWYWEYTIISASPGGPVFGITNTASASAVSNYPGFAANGWGYAADGSKYNAGTGTAYGASYATNDILGVAFDADTGSITFYKNNTSQGVAFSSLAADTYFPAFGDGSGTGTLTGAVNFGQRPFSYTPPTGFKALNTFNLPDSTIKKGNTVMDATLWTGTGSSLAITNSGAFKPDFVWGKRRNGVADNILIDSIVGGNPPERYLSSNTTSGTTANADVITSLNSNGFTVGTSGALNGSSNTYVGWQWQAGQGTTSSNTSGTITSTVSVNATAGFSVVTYTGNGSSSATVGHGLGVAPSWVIIKNRGAVSNWVVRHSSLSSTQNVSLNTTDAAYTVSSGTSNGGVGAVTSTTFGFISGTVGLISSNASSATYVAYCWAEIAGFSAFGSYTGNGSTDGPFVYTGFRPKFIIIKCTSNADSWYMLDTSRSTYNATNQRLFANASSAESSGDAMDILSNGFKNRSSTTLNNLNGGTYIYMAFAENPFKNSLAR